MRAEFRVGSQNYSDGIEAPGRLGTGGDLMVSDLNAKYYEQTVRGNMYIYSVAAAAAILITNTTTFGPTIWNPTGSGKVFVPVAIRMSFVSGTTTISSILWGLTVNAGSTISGTAPIITFTDVAARNANLGMGKSSVMRFAPATSTYAVAPVVICATGLNLGAAAPTGAGTYEVLLDGSMILEPGNALSLCCSVATTTSLWWTTIWGMELQIPNVAT